MYDFNWLRILLLFTIVVYFVYEYFDSKNVKDEREELIRLKTSGLVHQVTTSTLLIVAVLYLFFPEVDALYPIQAVMLSFLYTEILGKIYFRRKF